MTYTEYYTINDVLVINHVKAIDYAKEIRKRYTTGILLDIAIKDVKRAYQARKSFKKLEGLAHA